MRDGVLNWSVGGKGGFVNDVMIEIGKGELLVDVGEVGKSRNSAEDWESSSSSGKRNVVFKHRIEKDVSWWIQKEFELNFMPSSMIFTLLGFHLVQHSIGNRKLNDL
jgi:hypothetical protein